MNGIYGTRDRPSVVEGAGGEVEPHRGGSFTRRREEDSPALVG